jgi:signal transduction histidine kinase
MAGEREDAAPGAAAAPPTPIAAALRQAAARACEALSGGLALVFAHAPQGGPALGAPPLRSAAGFESADEARAAATRLAPWVRDAHESGRTLPLPDDVALLGGAVEGLVLPLAVDGRARGTLLVAARTPIGPEAREMLAAIAESAALRLDHAALEAQVRSLEEELREKSRRDEERGDEVLKLSEALFAQDIELLRNNEKLGKVERLKNDFIEKMSRELRTPLNSIIEAIISVLAGENEHLSETAKASLRAALDDGTSFLRTLQNILDLWRIKQGELPVESQEVNFREVVEEAIFSVQDTLAGKPVSIERRFHEPLPKMRTDLAKVNQILFLLLDNAVKFTQQGRIEIEAEVRGGKLSCQIRDTGIGICPDDRQYLFDEFFQVDHAASTRYRGAGLGLTLVRDLLALLDGEIELDSEVGVGTCVTFRVPVVVIG